ncbi:hypothetical protein [Niabella ginsenosidivorans]|nr:hypothetical protein [Niabella ginsenosidivorans]
MMKQFMKETGFTIRELAGLFGVSHSVVGHHLKGNRSLPTAALIQFTQLQGDWQAFCKSDCKEAIPVTHARSKIRQQAARFWKQEVATASFEVARLSRLLEQQQQRYRKLEAKLRFIILQRKIYTDKGRTLFLKIREDAVLQSMNNCCPEKQAILQYRLELAKQREQLAIAMTNSLQ